MEFMMDRKAEFLHAGYAVWGVSANWLLSSKLIPKRLVWKRHLICNGEECTVIIWILDAGWWACFEKRKGNWHAKTQYLMSHLNIDANGWKKGVAGYLSTKKLLGCQMKNEESISPVTALILIDIRLRWIAAALEVAQGLLETMELTKPWGRCLRPRVGCPAYTRHNDFEYAQERSSGTLDLLTRLGAATTWVWLVWRCYFDYLMKGKKLDHIWKMRLQSLLSLWF